jgi:prepilin-type N-terminal cleavage/methylation domain-containing protein
MHSNQGFTLLEVLLVAAMLALIAGFSVGIYDNYSRSAQLDATGKNIISSLRQMQSYAMAGNGRLNWGVHFVNTSPNYYELFSSPTNYADAGKVTLGLVYLPGTIYFTTPSAGNTLDIIFSDISGNTSATSLTIAYPGGSRIINVTASGAAY